ncbi:MAG: hypothetical protein ACPG7F_13350 [Aggregatilineales bacterium]
MTRQYPLELHIGQTIFVRFSPTAHAVRALVTHFDRIKGVVHVNPIGYKRKLQVGVRTISSLTGLYLHHENETFTFRAQPYFG